MCIVGVKSSYRNPYEKKRIYPGDRLSRSPFFGLRLRFTDVGCPLDSAFRRAIHTQYELTSSSLIFLNVFKAKAISSDLSRNSRFTYQYTRVFLLLAFDCFSPLLRLVAKKLRVTVFL